jgi:hypothetical protein
VNRRPGPVLLLACALAACAPEDPIDPAGADRHLGPPSEGVLLVDGIPLAEDEAEPLCRDILALYPEYSRLHALRVALTNELLPRLAARASAPERWREARDACREVRVDGSHGGVEAPPARRIEGGFNALGIGLWSAARPLPEGEWSEPIDLAGRWLRVRLDGRGGEGDETLAETLQLSLIEFPYVDPLAPGAAIEAAIDRARLELIDPEFAEAVPEAWKHRMRGSSR